MQPRATWVDFPKSHEFWIYVIATVVMLLPIFILFATGFPGVRNACLAANTCYCEAVRAADVGTPGVRQPINTWSNLYASGTALLVAFVAFYTRLRRAAGERVAGSGDT